MKVRDFLTLFIVRNAGRRKGRFVLGVLGVFVGVSLLTAVQVGLDSLSLAYIDFATIAAGKTDAAVMLRTANPVEPLFFDAGEIRRSIEAVDGVAGTVEGVIWGGQVLSRRRSAAAVLGPPPVVGSDEIVVAGRTGAEAGRPFSDFLEEDACLLSEALAGALAAETGDDVWVQPRTPPGEGRRLRVRAVVRRPARLTDPPFYVRVGGAAAETLGAASSGPLSFLVSFERSAQTALVGSDTAALRALDLGTFPVAKAADGAGEGRPFEGTLGDGECLVSATLAERMNLEAGGTVRVAGFRAPFGFGRPRPFTIVAVVEQRGVFPDFIRGFCVTSPAEAGRLAGQAGHATVVGVAFEDRDRIYDARDIAGSVLRARAVGEKVQAALGLDYTVTMPKGMALDLYESITSLLRGIFSLFGAVALAISALLIYSLLSISVEERIRENAILRTLGAKQRFIFLLVVGEGLLLCVAGSVAGIFGGIALTWMGTQVGTAFARGEGFPLEVRLAVRFLSVLAALGAGFVVAVISSLLPARRSVRSTIVEALNAYRTPPSPTKIIRERTLDTRLVAAGAVITVFMGFFVILIPRILASADPSLLAVVLGVVLLTLLGGMVLLSLGAQPVLERGVLAALRPVLGTSGDLVERNLRRYRRRNTSTSLMFSLSVGLVLFIASMAAIFSEQAGRVARFMNGADVRVETYLKPRIDFEKELAATEGVDRVARVSVGSMARSQDMNDLRIRIYASDLVSIRTTRVLLYGAGPDLPDALFEDEIRYAEGGRSAFGTLAGDPGEEGTGAVILPRSVASHLSVGAGSTIKISSRIGRHRAWRILKVAAVVDKMPGFPHFFAGKARAWGAGVLVSQETFAALLGEGSDAVAASDEEGFEDDEGSGPVQWRALYLVKTKDGVDGVGKKLREKWGWGRIGTSIRDTAEDVKNARTFYYSTQVLFTAILALAVVIAVFGLLASMYTSVLERKREVVILKSLGMRRGDLFRMFAGETVSLLLTSGTLGALIGFVLAFMLVSQQTAISELPTPFTVPFIPVAGMVVISIGVGLLGAWLPTRRLLRKSPAEIMREG